MKQDNLILIARLEKLLKYKLSLLDSLKITSQNTLIALENSKIEEFCDLLDKTERKIVEINSIDEYYNDIIKFDNALYMIIKEIYVLFNLSPRIFNESNLSIEYENFYNCLYKQYFLLIDLSKLNTDLQKKANSITLQIQKNLKNINTQKQLNSKYNIYNSNVI